MLAVPLSQCLHERILSIKQTYIFIHAECLFLARAPLSHMQIQSRESHMEWRCSGFLSAWKVGGKEAFSWSESSVNRALHPAQLFCKWIRSSGIILWIPQGQTDTDNCIFYFSALLLSLLVNVFQFGICLDHRNLFFFFFEMSNKSFIWFFAKASYRRSCCTSFLIQARKAFS